MRVPASTIYSPTGGVPSELAYAWMRFHEAKWCQGVDTVFIFGPDSMEVWCLVEDDKCYGKFLDMLAPLNRSYEIELYTTYPTEKKRLVDPPPSLWNNSELRNYFRNRAATGNLGPLSTLTFRDIKTGQRRDFVLRQRMAMYTEETLEWTRAMRRYAACLPSLSDVAFDPSLSQRVRERSVAICKDHAREAEKSADRIADNLSHAMPNLPKGAGETETAGAQSLEHSPQAVAKQIYYSAQSMSQSIYRFFYPRNHAVRVVDLKNPQLLDSLDKLRAMTSRFRLLLDGN